MKLRGRIVFDAVLNLTVEMVRLVLIIARYEVEGSRLSVSAIPKTRFRGTRCDTPMR